MVVLSSLPKSSYSMDELVVAHSDKLVSSRTDYSESLQKEFSKSCVGHSMVRFFIISWYL